MSVYLDDEASAADRARRRARAGARQRRRRRSNSCRRTRRSSGSSRPSRIWRRRSIRSKRIRCRRRTKSASSRARAGSASADALAATLRLAARRDRRPLRPPVARPPAVGSSTCCEWSASRWRTCSSSRPRSRSRTSSGWRSTPGVTRLKSCSWWAPRRPTCAARSSWRGSCRAASGRWWRWRPWLPCSVALRRPYLTPLAAAVNLSSVRFLSVGLCLVFLAGGMVVGCLGGLLASRRT